MLWTAFIWGLGTTVGGSIGLMLFVVLFAAWKAVAHSKIAKRIEEVNELSLQALGERNNLTREQILILNRIAASVEKNKAESV